MTFQQQSNDPLEIHAVSNDRIVSVLATSVKKSCCEFGPDLMQGLWFITNWKCEQVSTPSLIAHAAPLCRILKQFELS